MGLNSEKDSGDEHKKDENNHLYFNMTEIKWTTLIATATAIAESEWNQVIEEATPYSRPGENFISVGLSWIGQSIA